MFNEFMKGIKLKNEILSEIIADFQNGIKLEKTLRKKR